MLSPCGWRIGHFLAQHVRPVGSTGCRGINGSVQSFHGGNTRTEDSAPPAAAAAGSTTNSKYERGKVGDRSFRRGTMRSWELHSYSGPSDLQLTTTAKLPALKYPNYMLIRVLASSVNPIDVAMTKGYGVAGINVLRGLNFEGGITNCRFSISNDMIEFPLTLGRDFAGIVAEVGLGVKNFRVGDEVYGVLGVQRSGCHAEFIATTASTVRRKPKNLSFVQAASIPYVGLTTFSAVHVTGAYCQDLTQKRFLVLGGSGGVGNYMIQYLRASGAFVVSTCSPDAVQLLESLGTTYIVDYSDPDYASQIKNQGPFDCILDLTGQSQQPELCKYLKAAVGQYITLSPPFLSNLDKHGIVAGLARNLNDIVWGNWKSLRKDGIPTKWAFFVPSGLALETYVSPLVEAGKVKPVIQETFKFEDLPKAYEKLDAGHARGKIVIDFS